MKTRLNKFISECGIASRRKAEEIIEQGRVSVNDEVVKDLSTQVDKFFDTVKIDGEKVEPEKKIYYLLYKPKGFITSTKDEKKRKTVLDLIDTKYDVFPVGRLDYNTEGVLLLTNDGDFANLLTHPSNKVPRIYTAKLSRALSKEDKERLLKGITLDGKKAKFEKIDFTAKNNDRVVNVVTVEGRNRFVKRMFGALGYFVKHLKRINYAGLSLKGLAPYQYRKLSHHEVKNIVEKYG